MLELDRKAEVLLHAQAADIEFTIERKNADEWLFTIEGVSDINLAAGDTGLSEPQILPRIKRTFYLTDEQASSTLALFIGELENDEELNTKLYAIAEQVWKDVPQHFRPIP